MSGTLATLAGAADVRLQPMAQFMGMSIRVLAKTRLLVGMSASCLALTGCALWASDSETVTICGRGFGNDLDWSRARPLAWPARRLWKQYPAIEFEGKTSLPSKSTTTWYKNAKSSEFASCSRHSCETGRCLWRVRLYSKVADQWRIHTEYDLGNPRR
jgi:hypothetical protein